MRLIGFVVRSKTINDLIFDLRNHGWRVAVANLRFNIGYRIGGFKRASR